MSCSYCSVFARHPCESKKEASHCPNNENPGLLMDFSAQDVAVWIRGHAAWRSGADQQRLLDAAKVIEELM